MNLHLIDWCVLGVMFAALMFIGVFSRRYILGVSDFLAANRCAGRYLLATAEGMAGLGLITILAYWEQFYKAGFTAGWWSALVAPVSLVITLTGWVTYRYRQTKAMTVAQFFEMRYSRRFRIFMGIIAWLSGILNYGIFPGVTARAVIYLFGLPIYSVYVGGVEINITLAILMFLLLSVAIILTLMGGQITIMITDFLQGQVVSIVFIVCALFLIKTIGWDHLFESLKISPVRKSMLNPFAIQDTSDFNIWYFAMTAFLFAYGYRVWQGSQGFNCSAKSAHEARMAGIVGGYRSGAFDLILILAPICAYSVLHSDRFTELAQSINGSLAAIPSSIAREQMITPMMLFKILPAGLLGFIIVSFVYASVSCDNANLHSWGSIFVQDVILPIRNKPITTEQHLKWLRLSMIGVAVFAWVFSMVFEIREYIFMYCQITGAIYLGGAGAVLIGGLYWKRGTTAAAWWSMCTGSFLAFSSIVVVNVIWPFLLPWLKKEYLNVGWLLNLPAKFPVNSMQLAFGSALIASAVYVIVSLLTKPDPGFEMDRLLHRGKYAEADTVAATVYSSNGMRQKVRKFLGISDEFTIGDKIICAFSVFISMFWMAAFVVGTVLYLVFGWTEDGWIKWWKFKVGFSLIMALATSVWLLWGGIRDFRQLFVDLARIKRDQLDDGTVVHETGGHQIPAVSTGKTGEWKVEKKQ